MSSARRYPIRLTSRSSRTRLPEAPVRASTSRQAGEDGSGPEDDVSDMMGGREGERESGRFASVRGWLNPPRYSRYLASTAVVESS